MPDDVQPGVRIDPELYERFRDEVERRRGSVRGHLKTEFENALRDYIHGGDATPDEINDRLQRIEAAVGAAGADGGPPTASERDSTHARADEGNISSEETPAQKPKPNETRSKKIAYLAACVRDREEWLDEAAELFNAPVGELPDVALDNKIARVRYIDGPEDLDKGDAVPKEVLALIGEQERQRLKRYVSDDELPGTVQVDTIERSTLRDVVKDEYGFRRDTAKGYVDDLRGHFGLVTHPTDDDLLVTPEMKEEIVDKNASDRLDEL